MRILLSHQSTQYPRGLGVWGRTHDILPGYYHKENESEAIFTKQMGQDWQGKPEAPSLTVSPGNSARQLEGIGRLPWHITHPLPSATNVRAKGREPIPRSFIGKQNDLQGKDSQLGQRQGAGMNATKLKDQLIDHNKRDGLIENIDREDNEKNREGVQLSGHPINLDAQVCLGGNGLASCEKEKQRDINIEKKTMEKRTVLQTFSSQEKSLQRSLEQIERRPAIMNGTVDVRLTKALHASRESLQASQNSKKSRTEQSMDNLDLINELCQKSLVLTKEKGGSAKQADLDRSARGQLKGQEVQKAQVAAEEAINTLSASSKAPFDEKNVASTERNKEQNDKQTHKVEADENDKMNKDKPTDTIVGRRSTGGSSRVGRIGDPHLNIMNITKDQRPLSSKHEQMSKDIQHIEVDTDLMEEEKGSATINSQAQNSQWAACNQRSHESRNKPQMNDGNQILPQKESAKSQNDSTKRIILMRGNQNNNAETEDKNNLKFPSQYDIYDIVQERIKDIEKESRVILDINTQDVRTSVCMNPSKEGTENLDMMNNQEMEIMTKLPPPKQGFLYSQGGRCSYRMINPLQDTKSRNLVLHNANLNSDLSSHKLKVRHLDSGRPNLTGRARPSSAYVFGAAKKAPVPGVIRQPMNQQITSATCGSQITLMRQSQNKLFSNTKQEAQQGFTDFLKNSTSQTSFDKSPISGIYNLHIVSSKNLLMKSNTGTQGQQLEVGSAQNNILHQNADQFSNRKQIAEKLTRHLGDGSKHFKSQVRIASAMLGQRNHKHLLGEKAAGTQNQAATIKFKQYSEAYPVKMDNTKHQNTNIKSPQQHLLRNIEMFDKLSEKMQFSESGDSRKGQFNSQIDQIRQAQQDQILGSGPFLNVLKHADQLSSKADLQQHAYKINRNSSKTLSQTQGVEIAKGRPGRLADNSKLLENLSQSSVSSSLERARQKFGAVSKKHTQNALADLVEMSKHEERLPQTQEAKGRVKAARYGQRLRNKVGVPKQRNQKKMVLMSQNVKSGGFQNLLGAAPQDFKGVKGIQASYFDYLQKLLKSYDGSKRRVAKGPASRAGTNMEISIDRVGSQSDLIELESLISQRLLETRGGAPQVDPDHQALILGQLQGLREKMLQLAAQQGNGRDMQELIKYFKLHISADIDKIIQQLGPAFLCSSELPKNQMRKKDMDVAQQFMPQSRILQSHSRQSKQNLKASQQSLPKTPHQQNTAPRTSMLSSASGISHGTSERQLGWVNPMS